MGAGTPIACGLDFPSAAPLNVAMPEDERNADWLKTPSEVALSAGVPNTPEAVMGYLERQGLQESPLYRRLKAEPNFERNRLSRMRPPR